MTEHQCPADVPYDLAHELRREQDYWDAFYVSDHAEQSLEKQLAGQLPSYFAHEFARGERIFHRSFDHPAQLLVLGAGSGTIAVWCAGRYSSWSIASIDLSIVGLRAHDAISQRLGIPWRAERIVCDWDHLPFPTAKFDYCVVDRALHHMLRPSVSLRAVAQALKPGGILIARREPFPAV